MSFVRNAAGLLLSNSLTRPIQFLSSVLLARWLTVDDRGIYAAAVTFAGMTALLGQLGWPAASIYRLRRAGSAPRAVSSSALVFATTILTLLCVGGLVLRAPLTERFLPGVPEIGFLLVGGLAAARLFSNFFQAIARGIDRFSYQNAFIIGQSVFTLVALWVAIVLWEGGGMAALAALVSVELTLTLALVLGVLARTGVSWRQDRSEFVSSFRFGLKSYTQSLAGQMHSNVDVLMLVALLGDVEQVAYYAIAVSFVQLLFVLPDSIATALFPSLAGLPREQAATYAAMVSRHAMAWMVLVGGALGFVAPIAIPLVYGSAYTTSIVPFLVLLPGVLAMTAYRVLARFYTAIDRQQINIVSQLLSLSLNVALNVWWIPKYGILGAAGASLCSYSLEAVLILVAFVRSEGVSLSALVVPRSSDLSVYLDRLRPLLRRRAED